MICSHCWPIDRTAALALLLLVLALVPAARAAGGGDEMAGSETPEGVAWRLVRLEAGPVEAPDAQRAPSLTLQADGRRAHGSGGCNRFRGGYERTGAALRFTPLAATKMACPPPWMATESAYFSALERTRGWRRDGARLELLDEAGAVVAVFEAAPAP